MPDNQAKSPLQSLLSGELIPQLPNNQNQTLVDYLRKLTDYIRRLMAKLTSTNIIQEIEGDIINIINENGATEPIIADLAPKSYTFNFDDAHALGYDFILDRNTSARDTLDQRWENSGGGPGLLRWYGTKWVFTMHVGNGGTPPAPTLDWRIMSAPKDTVTGFPPTDKTKWTIIRQTGQLAATVINSITAGDVP